MKNRLLFVLLTFVVLFSCKQQSKNVDASPSDQDIKDAYVYMFSRYLVIQQEIADVAKVDYNQVKYNPMGSAEFVNPNMDVLNTEAWFAVDDNNAVILNVPEIKDRYYTAEIMDEWGEVITNVNERVYPDHPYGQFALVKKGSPAAIPAGAKKIELPGYKAKMLARVELKGTPKEALKLQQGFTIDKPANVKIQKAVQIPNFTNADPIRVEVFDKVEEVLASSPDQMPKAPELQAKVRNVANYVQSGLEARSRVDSLIKVDVVPFFTNNKGFGVNKEGWSVAYTVGKFGDDFLTRAIVNYGGIWANMTTEVIYFMGQMDSAGQALQGDNTYEIRFSPENHPKLAVDAYWALTLYRLPDYRVVPNPDKKYSVSNITNLKQHEDGSVSIFLSPSLPKGVSPDNWLPTPKGQNFVLTMRMYVPKAQVLDGTWFPAPIVKQ